MTQETWKPLKDVVELGDYYAVSSSGSVKNVLTGKILKPLNDGRGYLKVRLCWNKQWKDHRVYRLVALAFIPNPDNKPIVNHIDGDKYNNSALNLEWVTGAENTNHAFATGLISRRYGSATSNAKLSEQDVTQVKKMLIEKVAMTKIAATFGVSAQTIAKIKQGEAWTHVYVEGFKPTPRKPKGQIKLTVESANNIRLLFSEGRGKKQLAEQYGVSWWTIHNIVTKKAWKAAE